MTIGERLTEELNAYRAKNKLTFKELSTLLGMTGGSLSNYMRDVSRPGKVLAERLKNLGIDVDYIMTGKRFDSAVQNLDDKLRQKDKIIASLKAELSVLRKEIDNLREPESNLSMVAEMDVMYRNYLEEIDTEVIENPIRRAQRVAATPIHVKKSKD